MKKHFSLFILLFCCLPLFAQSNNNEDEVVKIDRINYGAYREGEVIVKFKDDCSAVMRAPRRTRFSSTQATAVDEFFATLGVDSVEELMPQTGARPMPRRIKAYSGKDVEPKNLRKLYRITLNEQARLQRSIHEVVEKLQALDEVEYAEPNYLVYAMSTTDRGDAATYMSEPLYSQQWGYAAINLPYLWNQPKVRAKRPVIAILDTGVDIEHPDLAANIWTNEKEAIGVEGQDDDRNGFKDDIHGWDFVNQRSKIADYNGHGTHCAGIAAAVGNNGIGITGANPDALIMPVVVMQADGTGDVATIIKGIDYAAANGADVISMSFGGYGYSLAEEQALGRAYATAVLVAAAGNDYKCIMPHDCPVNHKSAMENGPMFPAAFTFVLGVEASSQLGLASFSNFDEDGPIYSTFGEEKLYNYELRAPGVGIVSTFPGGRYKKLNGTSMACPMVAGAVSRLLQVKTDSALVSKEVLFGDLIHSRSGWFGNINMKTVYNYSDANRKPTLYLIGQDIQDTIVGDGDGEYDAGETIEFYPILRNDWGTAKNIRFWMRTGQYNDDAWVMGDTTQIHYLTDTVTFGKALSSYAKNKALNPIRFSVNPNCADGVHIPLTFYSVCDNMTDTLRQTFTITVNNGVEIGGMLMEDMTLYPDKHYIVTRLLAVPQGVTLTLKPGVTLHFKKETGLRADGHLIAVGKPDSLIVFKMADGETGGIQELGTRDTEDTLKYCDIDNIYIYGTYGISLRMKDCIINGIYSNYPLNWGYYQKCNFTHIIPNTGLQLSCFLRSCNIINNSMGGTNNAKYWLNIAYLYNCNALNNYVKNHIVGAAAYTEILGAYSSDYNYFGTSSKKRLNDVIADFNWTYGAIGYGIFDQDKALSRPSSEAHGMVWKVVIDGYDAQDEFEQLPPIGVGTHTCQVYFNRAMDTLITPFVSYGIRPPYTQHAITGGTWSADSTIYTARFTIDAKTASDGLNRFYVADAQDNEHFEVPIENVRFNMQIEAAGSMSTGLMAEAGLGKVTLSWETDEADFADLLGYNIYRWTGDTVWTNSQHTTFRIDTIQVNESLIDSEEQSFVDYNVTPGKPYYYIIRQITTSLSQYNLSNPVVATPLTSIKGDANGSMSVDVADVITEVNYIARQNPQPFIFEAADVNSDNVIDILDVVGTINLILHPENKSQAINSGSATYYIENGILYVDADVALGGVQFTLATDSATATITPLDALSQFEKVSQWNNSEEYFFMAYSMSGKTIGIGETALMQVGNADISSIVLSDTQGHNVKATPRISTRLDGTTFMPNTEKYIQNGNFYIRMGEHIYDAIGQQVR